MVANKKGVNTMMDLSSVIDASLTFAGVIAVVLMGVATVSTYSEWTGPQSQHAVNSGLQKAA
jgi:thiamine biosynthesis protein ThiC